jgi:hypothetical protein
MSPVSRPRRPNAVKEVLMACIQKMHFTQVACSASQDIVVSSDRSRLTQSHYRYLEDSSAGGMTLDVGILAQEDERRTNKSGRMEPLSILRSYSSILAEFNIPAFWKTLNSFLVFTKSIAAIPFANMVLLNLVSLAIFLTRAVQRIDHANRCLYWPF